MTKNKELSEYTIQEIFDHLETRVYPLARASEVTGLHEQYVYRTFTNDEDAKQRRYPRYTMFDGLSDGKNRLGFIDLDDARDYVRTELVSKTNKLKTLPKFITEGL